jgi:prepilin peptidase CpaA
LNLVPIAPDAIVYILIALLLLAAFEDAWRLRISNIICGLVLIGAIVVMAMNPAIALWQNWLVFAALLLLGFPLFAAGKFGGGDIKLLATTGAWFDLMGGLNFVMWVFLAGGALAVIILLARAAASKDLAAKWRLLGPKGGIPYGLAIAAGGLIMLFNQFWTARP